MIDRSTMAHPVHEASKSHPMGSFTGEEFFSKHRIVHRESFMLNRQGMKIFTQSWQPAALQPLRGVVAMIHGYACDSSWVFQLTAVAVAKLGFLVCALDLRGHGRSEGRRGHLPSVAPVVDDCIEYFESVRAMHPRLPAFLYGESLGGAMAVLVCLRQQQKSRFWSGLILHGAMCGITSKFKPPWPLETLLPLAAWAAPRWRVVLTKSLVEKSYKQGWVRELVRRNPRTERKCEYAPAATALEMIRVCGEVTRRSGDLEVPLLVVHGAEDAICDVKSAMVVYARARSKDKTLKIVAGMWHQLVGEEAETVEEGFGIIFAWLMERAEKASSSFSGQGSPFDID
ncbi:caffeoylshikimate esterase-like [Zingiber officinale]|uniref:caffeoylshikimate esterase-like n=1 Tax=Zingiber officinale TaxID=94328 RepID=UPI001C4AB99C|nr:caffeoylshikimate esterase-like [Zingiber officinale]